MPLPADVDYHSLLTINYLPMQIGLQTRVRLGIATRLHAANSYAEMKGNGITIQHTLKFRHLKYEASSKQAC